MITLEDEWNRAVQRQQLRQTDTLICLLSAALATWKADDEDFCRCIQGVARTARDESTETFKKLDEIEGGYCDS